jgi:hypothetical protein
MHHADSKTLHEEYIYEAKKVAASPLLPIPLHILPMALMQIK